MLSIAGITIANGGDNIGVYIPLLATLTIYEKIQFAIVFAVMVLILCMAGRYMARHPLMAKALAKYGHVVLPVVLFFLGVFIFFRSKSFSLLYALIDLKH